MDNIDTNNKATRALALLGLRAGKAAQGAVGAAPTIEEFGALYEGSLDATRRAQLLSHIAADPEVYRQWLVVVDAHSALEADFSSAAATAAKPESLLQRISNWLGGSFTVPALSGGLVAAALVAVVLLPNLDEAPAPEATGVDAIYADFGSSWQKLPSTMGKAQVRSLKLEIKASAEQQALYLGLQQGLTELGEDFPQGWLPQVTTDVTEDGLTEEARDALRDAGRLATLARFKCQLDGEQAFFTAAEESMDELRATPGFDGSKAGKHLARVIDQPGTSSERVCDFSVAVVALLKKNRR